ncbi:MAG: S8 family serine peptidase [Deltaproteobacteria bacterium]|nr:S8 family serine peptidase [Deltaproteobacteria bacterium]
MCAIRDRLSTYTTSATRRWVTLAALGGLLLGSHLAPQQVQAANATESYILAFEEAAFSAAAVDRFLEENNISLVTNWPEIGAMVIQVEATRAADLSLPKGALGLAPVTRRAAGLDRNLAMADPWEGAAPLPRVSSRAVGAAAQAQTALLDWQSRPQPGASLTTAEELLDAPIYRFGLHWDLMKIQADQAWMAGFTGDPSVTVAILSSGLDYTHPELAGKVDLERSRNFLPEDAAMVQDLFPGAHPVADLGLHGSYVASMIACNAFGIACVAPNITLVGVKVLNFREEGTLADLVTGILYAGHIRSDVIVLPEPMGTLDLTRPAEIIEYIVLLRAILRARIRGALVLAGAWPEDLMGLGQNADDDGPVVLIPAQAGATAVAATGTDDQWSGLSSFGFSLVDVAAPGGQVDLETGLPPTDVFAFSWGICSSFTQFDRFGSFPAECNKEAEPQYLFSLGLRPAVAFAASTAALIDSTRQGRLRGGALRSRLLRSADDVLTSGRDAFTGRGRINALEAVSP